MKGLGTSRSGNKDEFQQKPVGLGQQRVQRPVVGLFYCSCLVGRESGWSQRSARNSTLDPSSFLGPSSRAGEGHSIHIGGRRKDLHSD